MIERSPDALVIRGERLVFAGTEGREQRTDDVDEHVCLWRMTPPAGAPHIVRLLEERAPPGCYRTLLPSVLQDPARRVFASSRAVRRGVDGTTQWALAPHDPGVDANALLAALGSGVPPLEVVIHVAAALVEAFTILDEQARGLGVDNLIGAASPRTAPRSTLLVRPPSVAHVHFAFSGDVTLDVVTDKLQLDRPSFEAARMELAREAAEWRPRAHQVISVVVRRLQSTLRDGGAPLHVARNAHYDPLVFGLHGDAAHAGARDTAALLGDARIPRGRVALQEMLRSLFPTEHARACDLEEAAGIGNPERAPDVGQHRR